VKTVPAKFGSIEAAEAAGLVYDTERGRWKEPKEFKNILVQDEKYWKSFTAERIAKMSTEELQQAWKDLGEGEVEMDEQTMRLQVEEKATLRKLKVRAMRKRNNAESDGVLVLENTCAACSKVSSISMLACSRCQAVRYCDTKCQKQHWATHKSFCKTVAKASEEEKSKKNDVLAWYSSVPNLGVAVTCMAWRHRNESPFIKVDGGVNSRLANASPVPRTVWEPMEKTGVSLGYRERFLQADFDPNVSYFVLAKANHPGATAWPAGNFRMRFPVPGNKMDAWVEAAQISIAKNEVAAAERQEAGNPWVRLVGLKTESLNGANGLRRTWDGNKGRWRVELEGGRIVQVKPENLKLMSDPD
jgi:hypothetical protein